MRIVRGAGTGAFPFLRAAALAFHALLLAGCLESFLETGEPGDPDAIDEPVWTDSSHAPRAVLLDSGAVFFQTCAACHGETGQGGRGPVLANADFLMHDRERSIRVVLEGVTDSIRVNGEWWPGWGMPGFAEWFTDFEIAAVLTYIRAALNDSLVISCVPEDVEAGVYASCEKEPRPAAEIAADSIAVQEVALLRTLPYIPPEY